MSENNNSNNGGVGFVGLLQIVFIVLKLIGKITWSWGMVLIPIWGSIVLVIIIFVIIVLIKLAINSKYKK